MRGGSLLRRFCAACPLSALLLLAATPVSAEESERADAAARWLPAVGVVWGLFGQDAGASARSDALVGSAPPEAVRPPVSESQNLLNPFVGASFELMTPPLPGELAPRAFAHVDLLAALGFSFDVAKEGDPGRLTPPVLPVPEAEVAGQGSVTEAQVDGFVLNLGAGISFPLSLGDWRLRLKPSFEYIRERIEVSGLVHRAVRQTPPPPPATTDFRFIELAGQKTRVLHGIGPGVELEIDATRIGSFLVTVFVSGQAYALLGDRDIEFGDTQTDGFGTQSARFRFRPAPWLYRGSMGLRFRWLPLAAHRS